MICVVIFAVDLKVYDRCKNVEFHSLIFSTSHLHLRSYFHEITVAIPNLTGFPQHMVGKTTFCWTKTSH